MSHFAVLVIGENIEEQLAPYNEQPDEGSPYLSFDDKTDEGLEEYNSGTRELVKLKPSDTFPAKLGGHLQQKGLHQIDGDFYVTTYNDMFRKPGSFGIGSHSHEVPEDYEKVQIPLNKIYKTFDEFMQEYHGYSRNEEGRYGYTKNKNAKWDWWTVGGRYSQWLKLKPGIDSDYDPSNRSWTNKNEPIAMGFVDTALMKEIDFDGMRDKDEKEARERYKTLVRLFGGVMPRLDMKWEMILKIEDRNIDEKRKMYWDQPAMKRVQEIRGMPGLTESERSLVTWFDLELYQCSEDEYAQRAREAAVSAYAILKDGKWFQKGEMGWWGMSRDEFSETEWNAEVNKLLTDLSPETRITIVDCHI